MVTLLPVGGTSPVGNRRTPVCVPLNVPSPIIWESSLRTLWYWTFRWGKASVHSRYHCRKPSSPRKLRPPGAGRSTSDLASARNLASSFTLKASTLVSSTCFAVDNAFPPVELRRTVHLLDARRDENHVRNLGRRPNWRISDVDS